MGKVTRRIDELGTTAHALTDLTGRFLSVDDGFCDIVRRERSDILDKTILALTIERDRPLNADKLNLLRESGAPFVIRKTYIRGDGGTQSVENAVSLLTDGVEGSVLAATVKIVPDASDDRFTAMVNVARALLEEQKTRAALGASLADDKWTLLLAAFLLEAEGKPAYAQDICEAAGGDQRANLLRVWEMVHAGAIVVDGRASSLEQASLRVSLTSSKTLEAHLARTRATLK